MPGWITPAIPIVLLYLQNFEPGPEARRTMMALQVEVFVIFLFIGVTDLGDKLVTAVPNSLKSGGDYRFEDRCHDGRAQGGRVGGAPVSILICAVIAAYILFSLAFRSVVLRSKRAKLISNSGMVPGILIAMIVGWALGEFPVPAIEWGITNPDFALLFSHLPLVVGMPGWDMFLLAIPTAIIACVIVFGDILVGFTLVKRAGQQRRDEKIELNVTRVHLVTGIRNALHAALAPSPGLAGPLWTPIQATTAERCSLGLKAMDTIYSGRGTFWISGFLALFILPLVTMFRPVLPLALSLTLTAYICFMVGMEELKNSTEHGVAVLSQRFPPDQGGIFSACTNPGAGVFPATGHLSPTRGLYLEGYHG